MRCIPGLLGLSLTVLAGCQAAAPLTVMCFNIRFDNPADGPDAWSERRGQVFDFLHERDPDLCGLQEVLIRQRDELVTALPTHDVVGVGRDDAAVLGEFVPIFFRRTRFDLLDHGHFWLSPTPDVPGSRGWDAAITRMATWVRLRDRAAGGRELFVLNTHFDHRGPESRLEAARLLRQWVEARAGAPVILLGDFNTASDSAPYATLVGGRDTAAGATLLHDPFVVLGSPVAQLGTFHAFDGQPRGGRIDWILHTVHFEATSATIDQRSVDGRYPSDHFPVVVTLRWRP